MPTSEELASLVMSRYDPAIDGPVFEEVARRVREHPPLEARVPKGPVPDQLDLSKYLFFIRRQGAMGCWGYSALAVWDIMNEMACPYSPTLSMRIGLMLHRWRDRFVTPKGGIFTPDGRWFSTADIDTQKLEQLFGVTTEGTEPTLHYYPSWTPEIGWSQEGVNEAGNYRWASGWNAVAVTSTSLMNALAEGHPVRLGISGPGWGHFVAVVGYDKTAQTFKIVNSDGDNFGQDGFFTYTFQEIDAKKSGGTSIDTAETFEIVTPRPVPAARIRVTHTYRANVHLWLGVENSPLPRRKIWPHDWDDNSRNLHFTVRLPSEFVWPPSASNRLVLELYDAANYSTSGGALTEFVAAFGGHVFPCSALSGGMVQFQARQRLTVTIP